MSNTYQIYLISDSTGETLDRIFLAIKAQFENIDYKINTFSFTRTENQILKIFYRTDQFSKARNIHVWVLSKQVEVAISTASFVQ